MAKIRGRPKKKDRDRREIRFQIRVSVPELALIERAAVGKPSTWAREVLLRTAKKRSN